MENGRHVDPEPVNGTPGPTVPNHHNGNKKGMVNFGKTLVDILSEKQISQLKEVFSLFDKDDDGAITVRELETTLRIMGPLITEREIREIILNRKDALNVESDNVDFPEFLTIMASRMSREDNSQKQAARAVQVFDKDRAGFVKTSEIRNILTQVGEKLSNEEMEELINELDTDNCGVIKYDELMKALLTA